MTKLSLNDRILKRIAIDPETGCWNFTRFLHNGYGQIAMNGTTVRAHRLAYELFVGPIRDGYEVHHKCENRACCNPEHLEALSDIAHKKADKKWVGNRTQCKRGHPLEGDNLSPSRLKAGKRICKICACIRAKNHRARDPEKARTYIREYMREWHRKRRAKL